jgi:hypothetical protein
MDRTSTRKERRSLGRRERERLVVSKHKQFVGLYEQQDLSLNAIASAMNLTLAQAKTLAAIVEESKAKEAEAQLSATGGGGG